MTLLSTNNIRVKIKGRVILNNISIAIEPGEVVGLIGPNGAGKSTLMRALAGLTEAEGAISVAGSALQSLSARERARRLAFMPQSREIGWPISVHELVALGREPHRARLASASRSDRDAVESALALMEIADLAHRPATELSGGETARALMARALAQETPVLLADEPTAALDPAHQIGLMRLLGNIAIGGKAILVSLHDIGLAVRWCSRIIVMNHGRIIADGAPSQVITPACLAETYGIAAEIIEQSDGRLLVDVKDTITTKCGEILQ